MVFAKNKIVCFIVLICYILTFLTLSFLITLPKTAKAAAITAFTYKKQLTFDTSTIGVTENQAYFPIAVHINTSSWATQADRDHFFDTNTNGKRIQFYDADETTNLDYEVEYFSNVQSSEEAVYWVEVPQVDGSTTTDHIHVGYGNDPNGSDQDNKNGAWDTNYKMVQHLGDNAWGASPEAKDSTSTGINGTNTGTTDNTAQARRGRHFDGSDDDIVSNTNSAIDFSGSQNFTLATWVNLDALPGDGNRCQPVSWSDGGQEATNWDKTLRVDNSGNVIGYVNDGGIKEAQGPSTISVGTWAQIVLSYNGTNIQTYVNGAGGTGVAASGSYDNTTPQIIWAFWKNESGNVRFHGILDEARISNSARSANWIKLEYYSMKKTAWNGDDWLSWGAETSNPATISISTPADPTLSAIAGTGTSSGSVTWNVQTNNASGYKLEWQASADTMASGSDTIAAYTPAIGDTPETWSVLAGASEWGGRLSSTSTDTNAEWGTDSSSEKWLNIVATPSLRQIVTRASPTSAGGSNEIVQFKIEVGGSKIQPSGTYTINVTATATTL